MNAPTTNPELQALSIRAMAANRILSATVKQLESMKRGDLEALGAQLGYTLVEAPNKTVLAKELQAFAVNVREAFEQAREEHRNNPAVKLERLRNRLEGAVRNAEATLEEFQEKLGIDPAHAFEWGTNAVRAAARKSVYGRYLAWIDDTDSDTPTAEEIKADALRQALRGAQSSESRSTSPMSNLMDDFRTAAYAVVADEGSLFL